MDKKSDNLIGKFIAGGRLSKDEFILLEKLLKNGNYRNNLFQWMEKNWEASQPESVDLQFEQIKGKIKTSLLKHKMRRLYTGITKAAAVLFIPLLFAGLYFFFHQDISDKQMTIATQKAEQTSVILPDGSKVWLNVDTKLSYPVNFGVKSRNLGLNGEAYFEVEKNKELPFTVTSGNLKTTALGTKFSVSAYSWSDHIKTSLIEGSVEVSFMNKKSRNSSTILKPGEQFFYDNNSILAKVETFNKNAELGWMVDELVFELAPFENVIPVLEQWYNVKIHYDPDSFKSETLTVRFKKYESLETALKVIGKANGFKYTIRNNQIKIIK